jgi:hypothetical protein
MMFGLKAVVTSCTRAKKNGGADQVTEALIRFALTHGMVIVGGVGNPISDGYFGVASIQCDDG